MKNIQKIKRQKYQRRQRRVRAKIIGTATRPRLAVFRSLSHIYGQLIDDNIGKTLVSVSDYALKKGVGNKTAKALAVGKLLAVAAQAAGIKQAVFDRRQFKYHGRVKALADGAREGGLQI